MVCLANDPCMFGRPGSVRTIWCSVPGGALQPGEQRAFTINFRVLTTTRPYAMATPGGQINVTTGDGNPANDTAGFTALFRSTTGSLSHPRPYVRDTNADATMSADLGSGSVRLYATFGGELTDVDPADNTTIFDVTAVDAG